MLVVVQHQEHLPVSHEVQQPFIQPTAGLGRRLQNVQDRRRQQLGRRHGRQVDEVNAVREACGFTTGGLDGQPRLADAARAEDGEQPAVGVSQPVGDLAQLSLAADEERDVGRQVVARLGGGGLGRGDRRSKPAGLRLRGRNVLVRRQLPIEGHGLHRRRDA